MTLGDEVETLKDGQMKFSVELTNWKWCATLVSGAARFVDVTISIKSKKAPEKEEKKAKKPTVYELGNDAEISLSQKVGTANRMVYVLDLPRVTLYFLFDVDII